MPLKGYKGNRPQSRRLTASLFKNTHEIMKGKGSMFVILYLDRATCGRRGGVEKRFWAQKVRHTFDGESRPGDWNI
eukprot:1136976-Pelagomonas_calceolata.AAC.1